MSLDFLKDFDKTINGIEGVGTSSLPPRYWYNTGNYVLNKIMSGSYLRGIPQGRITTFAGPSSSGKSFLLGNVVKAAQQDGAFILVVDSENALDNDFMTAIGVDITNNYSYVSVTTVAQVQKVVSSFIQSYKKEYGKDTNAPQVLICIDSLSMLLTESELENYEKGIQKGDQGQKNKQLKAILRAFVQDIKDLNISMVNTLQVYKNMDLLNGEGNWIISDAVRYSASQIVLLTKLKLKDSNTKNVEGIRMKCEGYKTRFAKPFQTVTIEVPYDSGMDPLSGLLDVAVDVGVLEKRGSRVGFVGNSNSWYAKDFSQYAADVLVKVEACREKFLEVMLDDLTIEDTTSGLSATAKRKKLITSNLSNEEE